ncbi:MAG: beta-ketoacyl synthase chain length factor [Burkholderiales bacterium]|jgi:hypothetical protein|nr:beta-ketoacyl synthase chain length factor [Burkholderiales bacterium]
MISFSIVGFSAWAPGLKTPQDWAAWAAHPVFPRVDAEPAVGSMPPMMRRRADFHAKMALEVAYQCLPDAHTDIPTVFCSRIGEVARSVDMLKTLTDTHTVSPTSFSLSVHNAVAGLFSIARKARAASTSLAARNTMIENALIEAVGLLHDGAPKVLLVVSCNTLPEDYAPYSDHTDLPYAWAWQIAPPADTPRFSLAWFNADTPEKPTSPSHGTPKAASPAEADPSQNPTPPSLFLPPELSVLRFYLSGESLFRRQEGRTLWEWRRDE